MIDSYRRKNNCPRFIQFVGSKYKWYHQHLYNDMKASIRLQLNVINGPNILSSEDTSVLN